MREKRRRFPISMNWLSERVFGKPNVIRTQYAPKGLRKAIVELITEIEALVDRWIKKNKEAIDEYKQKTDK